MRSMQIEFYRGWHVVYLPKYGVCRGSFAGVTMNNRDRTSLADMIDRKIKECPHLQKKVT